MSSPPSSEGDPPDGGKSNSSVKNEAAASSAAAGEDEMEDIKQFVIRSGQPLKSDPATEVEKLSLQPSSNSKPLLKEEVKREEELRDEKERGLPPPLPQPKMYVMPKTAASVAAGAEKSPAAPTLSGQLLPPPATRQITIRAPTVQKAGIGPKIHLQQNIQVRFHAVSSVKRQLREYLQ